MYQDSEYFSLAAHFELLYRGRPLLTEEEAEAIIEKRADEEMIRRVEHRFEAAGEKLHDGEALSAFALRAIEILKIKANLSREQLEHRWKSPSVAADSIVYSRGRILLVKRKKDPYRGYFALPGGILEEHETLEQCALRELKEETGIDGEIISLLNVFSDPSRDPRVRMISAVYVVRPLTEQVTPGDDAIEAEFVPIERLPTLAFDHSIAVEQFLHSEIFRRLA